jgi:hypothetical protein
MTEKTKPEDAMKPYPDDAEGLLPMVKTVDPEHPEVDEKPGDAAQTT